MADQFDLEDFCVSSELVAVQMRAETPAEVINLLSQILVDQGYAKPTYAQAAIEREETFPTGLPTDGVRVAIPHAGVEHAVKPGLAIGTLVKPVAFGELGDADSKLDVSIVFLLCVTEPSEQVYLLQSLIEVYKDAELLRKLLAATESGPIVDEVNASLAAVKAKMAG